MVIEISTCSLDVICKFSLFFSMVWTLYENVRNIKNPGLTGVI